MAAVDTKRGYVGMCNGHSAQQESGAALSKNSMFTGGGGQKLTYYTRCALIRECQPTAWDDFARPAEAETTCIRKVSHQIVVERFLKFSNISVKYRDKYNVLKVISHYVRPFSKMVGQFFWENQSDHDFVIIQ